VKNASFADGRNNELFIDDQPAQQATSHKPQAQAQAQALAFGLRLVVF
jgi:hypothetical protein